MRKRNSPGAEWMLEIERGVSEDGDLFCLAYLAIWELQTCTSVWYTSSLVLLHSVCTHISTSTWHEQIRVPRQPLNSNLIEGFEEIFTCFIEKFTKESQVLLLCILSPDDIIEIQWAFICASTKVKGCLRERFITRLEVYDRELNLFLKCGTGYMQLNSVLESSQKSTIPY